MQGEVKLASMIIETWNLVQKYEHKAHQVPFRCAQAVIFTA